MKLILFGGKGGQECERSFPEILKLLERPHQVKGLQRPGRFYSLSSGFSGDPVVVTDRGLV